MQTIVNRWRGIATGAFLVSVVLVAGCGKDQPFAFSPLFSEGSAQGAGGPAAMAKATGLVEVVWPGGNGRVVPPGEEKLAFAEFNAFEATARRPARGEFIYRVLNADSTPHREIIASVTEAVVDVALAKAWFTGLVTSDVKICSGGSCDGHDDGTHDDGGCSGGGSDGGCSDGSHDDGGCSSGGSGGSGGSEGGCSDGTHDDGGCSGGGSDGGCSDGSHDDGGCSSGGSGGSGGSEGGCSDGTHDDGGCSGGGSDGGCSDGSHDDGGCAGGGSDGGHGGQGGLPGKDPRVGQVVLVKVHDVGTPGTDRDGIAWKWLAPGRTVDLSLEPKHMCKKEIIGGNLVVHPVPGP